MKQILCFGDSNTYGLIPGTQERYEWGIRWTSLLDEAVRNQGYHVVEEGLCGRTTVFEDPFREGRKGTSVLPLLLETHRPIDTVILMLGTNDCKAVYHASAETIGNGIAKLIDQILISNPKIKILLISPIRLGDKVWEDGFDPEFDGRSVITSLKLPEVYRRIAAEKNVSYLAASEYAIPSEADREHLDAAGHRSLANAVIAKLSAMNLDITEKTAACAPSLSPDTSPLADGIIQAVFHCHNFL